MSSSRRNPHEIADQVYNKIVDLASRFREGAPDRARFIRAVKEEVVSEYKNHVIPGMAHAQERLYILCGNILKKSREAPPPPSSTLQKLRDFLWSFYR
ncbi:hypothetical protein TWF281_001349 [Arthrobotrys megalospora]